jgi:hypothetical protein
MPRTLSHIRANLMRHPRFSRLHNLLAQELDDLR